jgi:hypothetical protein
VVGLDLGRAAEPSPVVEIEASKHPAASGAWLDPPDATPDVLKKRTLTALYNARPTWLAMLHADLDRAVWAAYGWEDTDPATVTEDAILARLLALNGDRAATA